MWFAIKIKAEKVQENGLEKTVTDQYLIDAISFSDAENSIIKKITPLYGAEFAVVDIRPFKLAEIIFSKEDADDIFFLCTLCTITLDEKSGMEKKSFFKILVQSADINKAQVSLKSYLSTTMADYSVVTVKETKFIEVYPYEVEEKK